MQNVCIVSTAVTSVLYPLLHSIPVRILASVIAGLTMDTMGAGVAECSSLTNDTKSTG